MKGLVRKLPDAKVLFETYFLVGSMTHNDDDLDVQLRAMLAVRRLPSLGRITVRVDDAVVYLGGTVSTYFERNTCEDCCRKIDGVVGIRNLIQVEVIDTDSHVPGAAVSP